MSSNLFLLDTFGGMLETVKYEINDDDEREGKYWYNISSCIISFFLSPDMYGYTRELSYVYI